MNSTALEKRHNQTLETLETMQSTIEKITEEQHVAEEDRRLAREEVEELTRKNFHLQAELEAQANSVQLLTQELDKELSEGAHYRSQCGKLQVDHESLVRSFGRLEEDKVELEGVVREMTERLEAEKSDNNSLRREKQSIHEDLVESQRKIHHTASRLEISERDRELSEESIRDLKKEVAKYRIAVKELKVIKHEIVAKQREIDARDSELSQLKKQYSSCMTDLSSVRDFFALVQFSSISSCSCLSPHYPRVYISPFKV